MASNTRSLPNTHFPTPAHPAASGDSSITRSGFTITTRKLPILKADPIDAMNAKLGITVPEMIFGDNLVRIEHKESGWGIEFNAFDALDLVDKTGESMLQVRHSKEWQSTRQEKHETISRIIKPFDWSYTTSYRGTPLPSTPSSLAFTPSSTACLPIDLLKRPDPILFSDELFLYEDEMADNGITLLSCKIRVMPERLLLLVRFFMRLDGVLVRLKDTRIYVEFGTGEVLREWVEKEEDYELVREKLASGREDVLALMRDPNVLATVLPVKQKLLERVVVIK